MKTTTFVRALAVSCSVAAAAACSNNNANTSASNPGNTTGTTAATDTAHPGQSNNSAVHTPVSINGCLQKGTGGTYLLTRLNEPAHKDVGSSGPASAVEQEQLWMARNEYRIDPQHDVKVDDLVGKQVRVTGTIVDAADLPTARQEADRDRRDQPTATSGTADRNSTRDANGADIKQGDLAKIDASAVSMIAASCGSKGASASGTHAQSPRAKGTTGKK